MVIGGEGQSSSREGKLLSVLPAYDAAVSGTSSKKQETPQHLERLQSAPSPEDKKLVRTLDHVQKIRNPFHFNSQSLGFLGTAVVVGPRAFSGWTRLLLDAVTQQPTCSQGAGASDAPARLKVEEGLGVRGTSGSTKPRPLRNSATRGPARLELLHVGGAGASRHRLLMNNVDSGGVPDPEVELPSHRSG